MCGITGFIDFAGTLTEADLRRMNATISRRGPDGEGYLFADGVGLAMRRLAIIDIDGGWQPVFNEDKSVAVVFNGEIYNYRQLRKSLIERGHTFRTSSDTEVIVHLYEEHGDAFTTYLEGMFAIALWDSRKRRLVLARDRLGIKPLYIARMDDGIIFGSELKAVLASGKVDRAVNWNAVDQYFAYTYIPAPMSIYAGVCKLLPAHQVSIGEREEYRESCYWTLPQHDDRRGSMEELETEVEQALLSAVESHMISDVPVGAFLSGGVDSSVIVAMMTRFAESPVQAFTVGFSRTDARFIDERVHARELAKRYGLKHVEIEVTPDVAGILPEIVEAFDEPFADDSVIPSYYVSQATSRAVKVAMTGLGGDELFGGYKRHLGVNLSGYYRRLPESLRKRGVAPLARLLPEGRGDSVDHLKRFVQATGDDVAAQYRDYLTTQSWAERRQLYGLEVGKRIDASQTERVATDYFRHAKSTYSLERALRTDLALYLPDDILTLTDRLSMWHSLELRVPFLDRQLVEIASRLPPSAKIRGFTQKRILRSIARRWVPESILNHRKQGFEAPMGTWLRGPLLPLFDEVASPQNLQQSAVFNSAFVRRLRNEHVGGVRKNSKVLFCLLMFLQWAQQNRIELACGL
jgi:asparagine synthase (glutamine-hydrolysing)